MFLGAASRKSIHANDTMLINWEFIDFVPLVAKHLGEHCDAGVLYRRNHDVAAAAAQVVRSARGPGRSLEKASNCQIVRFCAAARKNQSIVFARSQ